MEDLRKVAKPTKDNWKLWVTIGNNLIDEYEELLGLSEPEIDDTGYRDKIRDSIISVKDMFALLEAESAFKKRQKRKDLDNRWNYWKKVILRAYKDVPGPAKDAYKNIIRRRDKIYFAATDSSDPALGGSSGFDSGTKSTGTFTGNADDVEQDAIKTDLENLPGQSGMGMQSQIDPSNRVSKDQKDRDGYAERVKNLLYTFSTDSGDLKNSVRKAKRDLRYIIAQLPNKEAAKYSTMFYSGLASKLGVQGLVRSDHIVFADGSKEKVDRNNDTHKEIVQAQFDLGLIDSTKANKLVDRFDLQDLPSSSGMSQQMKHGTKGFKNTGELQLKGTSKTLPPLTSKTVNDYVNTYLGILRKYKRGTGKGGGSIGMPLTYKQGKPTESKAYTIREHLNILLELESKDNDPNALKQPETAGLYNQQRSKISDLDKKDLEAIENAFKTAQQRKAIKPEEHTKFTQIAKYKEQLFKKLGDVPKMTKGDTPDTLKKAMAIKAPGSDKNYGVFNDQVIAVLNNPTPENLIKQAEAVSAMDLDGVDTDRMKFSAFYGHVANAMGLAGMITHRNSFMNSPMVVLAKARKTDFSDKMPEMLPFGEYSVEAVDFDNPRHKAVAQAQLNKNLLPASMQMSRNNTVNDVYKRFGITKQEPQEPVRTGAVGPTVKSGIKSDKMTPDEWGRLNSYEYPGDKKDPEIDAANQPEPDASERPDFTGTRKELPPTDKSHYERFIQLPVEINSLLKLSKKRQYYVDRVRDSKSNVGANLSDTLNIVNQDTAEGGSYNIARQVSQDMSEDAYKAIIDMLKSRNLEFIDQAQADKFAQFKATNKNLDANQGDPIDPEKGGDLWSQSQFGKDAIAKKQAERDRMFNYDANPDSTGSGLGSPGSQDRPASAIGTGRRPGEAVYYDIINAGGQSRQKIWVEYDANGEVVRKGKENEEYQGKLPSKNEYRNSQSGSRQKPGHSYGTNYHPSTPDKPKDVSTTDQDEIERLKRLAQSQTGNADAPAEVNPLNQEPNPPTNTDPTSTGDVPERYKIQQITDANGKTQWRVFDSKNALTPVKIVNTEDDAKKVANQLNTQAAKKSGVGSDSSSPVPVDASANNNSLKNVINNAQQQLDQNSTNFTRLLKNAGLLKEFY